MNALSLYTIVIPQRSADGNSFEEVFISGSNLILQTDLSGSLTALTTVPSSSFVSASYSATSGIAELALNSITASYSLLSGYSYGSESASYANSSSFAQTASYAVSASFSPADEILKFNAGQAVIVGGTLQVNNIFSQTGNNLVIGQNQDLTSTITFDAEFGTISLEADDGDVVINSGLTCNESLYVTGISTFSNVIVNGVLHALFISGSLLGTSSYSVNSQAALSSSSSIYSLSATSASTSINSISASTSIFSNQSITSISASYIDAGNITTGILNNNILPSQLNVTGITASINGTSSISRNSNTASYITASNINGIIPSASFSFNSINSISSSYITASNVVGNVNTASFALNYPPITAISQSVLIGSSSLYSQQFIITGSYTTLINSGYTLTQNDNGKLVIGNSNSNINITVPLTLNQGFSCTMYQSGSGQIIVIGNSGVNIRNRAGLSASYAQYSAVSLLQLDSSNYLLQGDCA